MPVHKLLHLIGPIIVLACCFKVLKLSTLQAVSITILLGLSKELYDVIIVGDSIIRSLLDMVENVIGTAVGFQMLRIHKDNLLIYKNRFSRFLIRHR
ncbi:hypothetical protein Desaci_4528 [Desulfosporosinus acidiphilus SJ4]|uniref:Uncharacterized protein n=1 Tax=Desulfosporosinus acidiphilus (strain DSM 22704 / JCM 16185 / SJ4) TaxID=646529 RepID=I4DC44_DESAJ|nr:hypothetical protein Desaci_4528 [Desulfosporosinus acidiphilus SJ4]